MSEPKDCPYCGSQPGIERIEINDYQNGEVKQKHKHLVACLKCGLQGPDLEKESRAVQVWNDLTFDMSGQ